MDWISGVQRALDYVENHITEPIHYEDIAKCAYVSSFHFQKMFGMLCGYSLGEYIRRRRLSLAGEMVSRSDAKIIDIALEYGYETPESFSRAFTKFHGITPTEARHGGCVKTFSRISVKLTISGGHTMQYRIETLDKFKVVCKRQAFTKNQELTTKAISEFWQSCQKDGSIPALCAMIPQEPKLHGLLGISFTGEGDDEMFPYGIGTEYREGETVPAGCEVVEIPQHTYAVFTVKGPMPDAFVETYRQICTEFFPQSGYTYAGGIELEVYPSADVKDPNYSCEIWVSVAK